MNRISNNQRDQYMNLEHRMQSLEQKREHLESRLTELENSVHLLEISGRKRNEEFTAQIKKIEAASLQTKQLAPATPSPVLLQTRKATRLPEQGRAPLVKPAVAGKPVKKDSYIAAYLSLKGGKYATASDTFEKFLSAYPNDEYSDQAYYWLGVSYYAQKNIRQAIDAFLKVATDFPKGSKHKQALLKLAQIYGEQHQEKNARVFLNRLLAEHPGSPEAAIARRRLASMQTEKGTRPKQP